jgi:hypothetical protein
MINDEEARLHAIAAAVAGAGEQLPLDARVNIIGSLIDMDQADSIDVRRYCMCWHLTRVLGPSLSETIRPAVVRAVVRNTVFDTKVDITGPLIDTGQADSIDVRRYCMCWHLTRVLGPSSTKKVSPPPANCA